MLSLPADLPAGGGTGRPQGLRGGRLNDVYPSSLNFRTTSSSNESLTTSSKLPCNDPDLYLEITAGSTSPKPFPSSSSRPTSSTTSQAGLTDSADIRMPAAFSNARRLNLNPPTRITRSSGTSGPASKGNHFRAAISYIMRIPSRSGVNIPATSPPRDDQPISRVVLPDLIAPERIYIRPDPSEAGWAGSGIVEGIWTVSDNLIPVLRRIDQQGIHY